MAKQSKKTPPSTIVIPFKSGLTGKKEGIKHMILCHCILPQFKNISPPVFHKFIVFSIIEEPDGHVVPSYVQCNNCNVVHKIVEINQSIILKKESSPAVQTIDDIKLSLPEKLVGILEKHDLPLATWQEVQFIIEQKHWGRGVVLTKEQEPDKTFGKYLVILGETLFKIDTFEREEGLV